MTPKEELARWERVRIESMYMVLDPDTHENGSHWEVMDAECEHIGRFPTKEMAEVVAEALEDYDRKMRALWEATPRHSEDK